MFSLHFPVERTSLCGGLCERGQRWGGGPGARLQEATPGPLLQAQFHPQRLAAAGTRRPSGAGTGLRRKRCPQRRNVTGIFTLETGLDTLCSCTGGPQPPLAEGMSCPANFKTQNCQELRRTPSQWMWGRWDRERFPFAVHLGRATSSPWRFLGAGNAPLLPFLTEKPRGLLCPPQCAPGRSTRQWTFCFKSWRSRLCFLAELIHRTCPFRQWTLGTEQAPRDR